MRRYPRLFSILTLAVAPLAMAQSPDAPPTTSPAAVAENAGTAGGITLPSPPGFTLSPSAAPTTSPAAAGSTGPGTVTLLPTTSPSMGMVALELPPTTEPATQPTTQPITMNSPTTHPTTAPTSPADGGHVAGLPDTPRTRAMPGRSIFQKGRPTANTTPSTPTTLPSTTRQERNIVFDGVTDADGEAYAMFEDTSVGKIMQLKTGDAIAGGKITQITLDAVTYESNGHSTRVAVGQTLDAGEAPLLTSRASISSGSPTTGPSVGTVDDLLEKLRAKRRKELGQ